MEPFGVWILWLAPLSSSWQQAGCQLVMTVLNVGVGKSHALVHLPQALSFGFSLPASNQTRQDHPFRRLLFSTGVPGGHGEPVQPNAAAPKV